MTHTVKVAARPSRRGLALAAGVVAVATAAAAPARPTAARAVHARAVQTGAAYEIAVTNLTDSQTFSPPVFFTHTAGAPPLFTVGQPASFGLMRIAEEGNAGPLLSATVTAMMGPGQPFGDAATGISVQPGKTQTVRVRADGEHMLLSGAMMLVKTNDGFTGVSALDLGKVGAGRTLTLDAYDAGTEKNNERAPYLIARMGTDRDPEGGVVARHPGIRGDADAPKAWDWGGRPVARLTVRRVP